MEVLRTKQNVEKFGHLRLIIYIHVHRSLTAVHYRAEKDKKKRRGHTGLDDAAQRCLHNYIHR